MKHSASTDKAPSFKPGQLIRQAYYWHYITPLTSTGEHMYSAAACPTDAIMLYIGLDPTESIANQEGEWGIVIYDGRKFSVCLIDFVDASADKVDAPKHWL